MKSLGFVVSKRELWVHNVFLGGPKCRSSRTIILVFEIEIRSCPTCEWKVLSELHGQDKGENSIVMELGK